MITVGLGAPTVIGQSSSTTTFSVTRNPNLSGRVWPGDFNGDGVADLAASAPRATDEQPTAIQVVLGDGRGGFGAPIATSVIGEVLGTGDFNRDGRQDLVVVHQPSGGISILPGNGNGTFANERLVTTAPVDDDEAPLFAMSADLNGDGKRDLVVGGQVFPGRGDFTFDPPIRLQLGLLPADGILVDVNGDGRRDVVVANRYSGTISVLLNHGSFVFTGTELKALYQTTDVTAADLNGDGRIDLVFSAMAGGDESFNTGAGKVGVMFGRGDGTFTAPTLYDVERGAWQVVVGDFTRDGIIDIATANRSSLYTDDFCNGRKTWDTVTILPGRGDGTFGARSSFSIGDQRVFDDDRFKNAVLSLNTSDLDGDRQTDLIASWGAVLLNRPPRANVAPTVDAGADRTVFYFQEVLLAGAADADDDMLLWTWTDSLGAVIGRWPQICDADLHQGRNVFTVTVDDQHGHVASDTVTLTYDRGPVNDGGADVAAAPDGENWRHKDVGSVAVPGNVTYADGKFTVKGSGADIWGTADEFQYAYRSAEFTFSDVDLVTRVDSVDPVHRWTKAGLMFRETLDPGSRHVSLFVTPEKGIAFQYRAETNQISTTVAGPLWTAPVWLRLSIRGARINAYYKRNASDAWIKLGQRDFPDVFGHWTYSGLAVTSHADGASAAAVFSNTSLRVPTFTTSVIGGGSGTALLDRSWATLTNRGTDIWNSSDQFTFLSMPWDGDGTGRAYVEDIGNTYPWAKAGLMFRESLAANSPNVAIVATPGRGISFQFRTSAGATSQMATPDPGGAPVWLRLSRTGNTFTGEWTTDGSTWNIVGSIEIAMRPEIQLGLAVTSHNTSATTTAHFSSLSFSR